MSFICFLSAINSGQETDKRHDFSKNLEERKDVFSEGFELCTMVLISAQVLDYQDFLANTSNIDLLSKKWQIRSKSVMVIFGQNENGIGQSSL